MSLLVALAVLAAQPANPLEFGKRELASALGPQAAKVQFASDAKLGKEAYRIVADGKTIRISGGDTNGSMYGAFEVAERYRNAQLSVGVTSGKPYLADRGLNLFLTLPWDYKKNDTDYSVEALTDPNRWWFQNEDYWTTLLDIMAKSRLNWLDIHGGWDVSVTNAPNMYAYFVTSPSFPKVGVSEEIKKKDLAQLNHVIQMAHARGIRVSLMCYEANLRIPQNPNPGYEANEANIYKYTKEVVEQMIRKAPGLDAIGYRIGESGHGEEFFKCYGEAIKASGRDIPIVTRSWITRKQKVLPLARDSKDFTVEIKYNGEQWGAPYMVAGGRMANWGSYSFEDYLSDSGTSEAKAANMWPGNPISPSTPSPSSREEVGPERWPSEPYKIVWQVRANGTHRIFPFYNPQWVRRSIEAMKVGTASGYTIEGEDAYCPKAPDYYMAKPGDRTTTWIHQRDEMYWTIWGRLGYDPKTPDATFDNQAKRMLGPGSEKLLEAWKAMSTAMPKDFMAYSLGPDHRNHAPELEWGGDTGAYIAGQGFDTFAFMPTNEAFANRATGGIDGRYTAWDLAVRMNALDKWAGVADQFANAPSNRQREIANVVKMQAALAKYYAGRFMSAHGMANVEATVGASFRDAGVERIGQALAAHSLLASNPFYRPFTEKLRMHTNTFSWAEENKKVKAEADRIAALPAPPKPVPFWIANSDGKTRMKVPARASLTWAAAGDKIVCHLVVAGQERAWLLVKPLPSSQYFHRIPMQAESGGFVGTFHRDPWGHQIAAEIVANGVAARVPDPLLTQPYLVVPSLPGPTPQLYATDEALAFLNPDSISPERYGAILIGTRAANFFRFDVRTQRKLLEPVSRGMKLIILQEDFAKDKLDFLAKPLKFEPFASDTFDPGGQLGLEKATAPGMMWFHFVPSPGWEVFGNGGLARLKVGKGEVWVTTARLMQTMHYPTAAKAFVRMLSIGGKEKPTVLVDSCSEGGEFTSSCHPDLMNSHDIPFLTLGEVIAKEQGMNSFTPIAGKLGDDDILQGNGERMANAFLKAQVVAASTRPTPANVPDFEKERARRKAELLRSLGLDPMPPRTPLNARITGVIQRNGYRIEKLVFESRPKFYVTAHVYVPTPVGSAPSPHLIAPEREGPPLRGEEGKFPIVVHVNGHWAHKKDEDRIQFRAAFCALQGYIAIAVDSPGWSFEGNSLIERRPEGNHNDWFMFNGGTNATGYYVWDCMRALDYMATRPDTDMSRIGITGASGGGLATLYTFAADDRYTAAVPVVYMASLELAPDNGCLCNHVPGTCQIGDRSDVIAIQAPKPVFIMGAQNDGEFPPDATRLTHKKMAESWALFGKKDDVFVHIYDGPHDYNQLMREQMIGFFNKYLKGGGDGSPVPQPPIQIIDPEDRQILAMDPVPTDERTMRDLSLEYLSHPMNGDGVAINGGKPAESPLNWKETAISPTKRLITFESEPGLVTPAVLLLPEGKPTGYTIHAADGGKASVLPSHSPDSRAHLYVDILGTGELAQLEMRYLLYLGQSVAFKGGWQLVRASREMRKYGGGGALETAGPLAGQAAYWAGMLDHDAFGLVARSGWMERWEDALKPGMSPYLVQPRAHLMGPLNPK